MKPVLSLLASRRGRSVANALRVAFVRTADLYHVKADWPHQDTRGHSNFSGMLVQKATLIALRIGQLVNKTNPSNGSVAPK